MNDREIRESESITRIREFGVDNAADFPSTSLGGQKFAGIKALAEGLVSREAIRVWVMVLCGRVRA